MAGFNVTYQYSSILKQHNLFNIYTCNNKRKKFDKIIYIVTVYGGKFIENSQ